MSPPWLELRVPSAIAALALVSVLHTSVTAQAQTPATPPARPPTAQPPSPPAASPAAAPSTAAPSAASPPAAPPSVAPATAGPAAAPPAAPAPDTGNVRERARAAYTAGRDAYAAGQYAAAEAHFSLADSLLPAVQAKYWRAMSLDQLGDVPRALAAFEAVLASPDKAQLGADKVAIAEARQRALAATPAELTLTTTPAGAHVNVSGVDLRAPTPLTLKLAPGRHVVRVSLDGYEPQQVELQVTPGAKLTPTLTLVPLAKSAMAVPVTPVPALPPAPGPAPAPAPPAPRSRIPGYVTLGIAGASAVVGSIFGIQALGDKQEFEDDPTTKKADDVERNALIADMAFGVTLTLGITGIVLLVADDPVPEQPQVGSLTSERLRVAPYVSPNGAGAAAQLEF